MVREKTKKSQKKGFDLCSFDLSAEQAYPVTEVFMACHISYLPFNWGSIWALVFNHSNTGL